MRSIVFTIPGEPDVIVSAVEQANGSILFQIDVDVSGGIVADLRGLFFNINDPAVLETLQIDGADVTEQGFGDVSNLGHGNNMKGSGREQYDVGMSFGTSGIGNDDIQSTSFTLSSQDGVPLTLDLIANVEFGARLTSVGDEEGERDDSLKLTTIAPAAPDAIDDNAIATEDTPLVIDVLANDTDADGDTLTIVDASDPGHGTVAIVDNQIVYTPDLNYGGGPDSFTYSIDDGNGGSDVAQVDVFVEAVADAPTLSVEVVPGGSINEIRLLISSELTDTDGSESLALHLEGDDLPEGASLSRTTINAPGAVEEVLLTLPPNANATFDLGVTAVSTEASNGDMATTTEIIDIVTEFNAFDTSLSFIADDQSIWGTGDEFSFMRDDFLGIDTGYNDGSWGLGSYEYDLRVGLQSTFSFGGGSIDATIPFDVAVDSFYNVTTDILSLTPMVELANGGSFLTNGPYIDYDLSFIFDVLVGGNVSIEGVELLGGSVDIDESVSILSYDSQDPTQDPISIGSTSDPISVQFDWPELDVAGNQDALGFYSGDGASNNVLNLNIDADASLTTLFGLPNPFDITLGGFILGTGAEGNLQILDLDLFGGLNFLQEFDLAAGDIEADIMFEDGSVFDFDLSAPTTFSNASSLDDNEDGDIAFELLFDLPSAELANDTDLNFNVGYNFDVLKGSAEVKVAGISLFDESFGPAFNDSGTADVAQIGVYDDTFNLEFGGDTFNLIV
jgi:hypothetical protein